MSNNNASSAQEVAVVANDAPDPPVAGCQYCRFDPCLLDTGLYQSICQVEQDLRNDDATITNKEVRFHLYRHVTDFMHGYLGKGTRIEIPVCRAVIYRVHYELIQMIN